MSALEKRSDPFPIKIFMIYVLFYAGQAMYNTYLNLYLYDHGLTQSMIGTVTSISTIVLVLIQPLWGVLSDKSKAKNQIVGFLLLM